MSAESSHLTIDSQQAAARPGRWRLRWGTTLAAAAAVTGLAVAPAFAAPATHHGPRLAAQAVPTQTARTQANCPSSHPIQGQVWAVTPAQTASATFPAPSATPDLTFCTSGITYIGQWNGEAGTQGQHCFTIGTFLNRCPTASYDLTYSGLPNPNLGGTAMTSATPMAGASYGIMIEFTDDNVCLPSTIQILHDDGVSLEINSTVQPGFNPGITAPLLQSESWTGPACGNDVNLLYANSAGSSGQGAWLEYLPKLY
jgi:hypothetical protein